MTIYDKNDKRRLYWLINSYIAGQINDATFCDELYYAYDLEIDKNELNEAEKIIFEELDQIAQRFSPYKDDHQLAPGAYTTKDQLRAAIVKAQQSLQLHPGPWTKDRVVEKLSDEWSALNPQVEKDITIYNKKSLQISFKGEVNVALDVFSDRPPDEDTLKLGLGLSLSPKHYDRNTHVLNTFDFSAFLQHAELKDEDIFSISKYEPWEGSAFAQAASFSLAIINEMLTFESCFHLLLDDEHEINGSKLDMTDLSINHHIHQVQAYRLAQIYNHPEKLDEAIAAIKRFAQEDAMTSQRLKHLCSKKPKDAANWLYTEELLEKLCR